MDYSLVLYVVPYSRKSFKGENFRKFVENGILLIKLLWITRSYGLLSRVFLLLPSTIVEKTFANRHETEKFAKALSNVFCYMVL